MELKDEIMLHCFCRRPNFVIIVVWSALIVGGWVGVV